METEISVNDLEAECVKVLEFGLLLLFALLCESYIAFYTPKKNPHEYVSNLRIHAGLMLC